MADINNYDPTRYKLTNDGTAVEPIPEVLARYNETRNAQMEKWANGIAEHNTEFNECVIDFSCCSGQPIWPLEQRIRYMSLTEVQREELLKKTFQDMLDNPTGPPPVINPDGSIEGSLSETPVSEFDLDKIVPSYMGK